MQEFNGEMLEKIGEALDLYVRPSLKQDGGDISIVSLDGNILSVKLHGTCSHCPRAMDTLRYMVEGTLHKFVSDKLAVNAI